MDYVGYPPPSGRFRGALRRIGWNALLMVAGVALVALAGEAWFRLTVPFMKSSRPLEHVPNVGSLRPPNTEIRHTNGLDYWNASRTNSLGFLDREPPNPERAAATCHVSIIGDSFVEAMEVPIDRKLQVRLEELAASRLPHLDVTTSAFGLRHSGQVQQLPFYDEYARRLRPKLLVLVFVDNDFLDNTPVLRELNSGRWGRGRGEHRLEPIVRKRSDGELELGWSSPQDQLPPSSWPPPPWTARAMRKMTDHSWLAIWLYVKKGVLFPADRGQWFTMTVEALRRQPGYAALLEGWQPTTRGAVRRMFTRKDIPPFFEDALQYTRFALEQFQQRADRDGATLVILATHGLKLHGTHAFERMSKMAATLGIPVIDHADYILRQGAELADARWPHDAHWSPAGHQWAAEALFEYIEQRPEVCDG